MRELKALELAARSRIAFDGVAWSVPSQTAVNVKYVVTLSPPSCTCDDYALIAKPCKHVMAAKLVDERENGKAASEIRVDEVPVRPTYKQNWKLYNVAQVTEKHRFQELLFDLCRGIQEPEGAKTGRKRALMRDMVFSSAFKVYSTVSSRRFGGDLKDAHARDYLTNLMNPVSICAYLESELMTPVLDELIVRSSLPLKAIETTFAPDSTGFSTSRFVRWFDEKYGCERSGHDWVKAHAITGVKTNIVTSVRIEERSAGDCPQFKPLVEQTAKNFKIETITADKAYLSRENLELANGLGATAYIPFKTTSIPGEAGSLWEKMFFYYQFKREEFLKKYHARSNVESTFSMIKAKFRDHVRSRTDRAMKNEVLCKFLCHNIVVVHQSMIELGIEAEFWPQPPKPHTAFQLPEKPQPRTMVDKFLHDTRTREGGHLCDT